MMKQTQIRERLLSSSPWILSRGAALVAAFALCVGTLGAQRAARLPRHLFATAAEREPMQRWADSVYRTLSLEEQVGQLIMPIVYPSSDAARLSREVQRVRAGGWGGILYQKGLLSDQLTMDRRLQAACRVPMLIALDGEWGLYMRLKDAPRYPRNMGLGLQGSRQLIYDYGREVARQCRLMGIHINFAPDVDVNINPNNPVIGTRSFGEDPKAVAECALAYAAGLEDGDVLSVAKHFPGHGDTSEDSHHTLPTMAASKKRMKEVELLPFARYISEGYGGIMTAHLRVPAYEASSLPSSLSHKITTTLLRDELGFSGLVFTDGLEMKGVTGGKAKEIGVLALLAGNDVLLGPSSPEAMQAEVVSAVRDGRISADLLRDKVMRVLYYKWRLIVRPRAEVATPQTITRQIWTPEARQFARALWRASLHFVRSDKATMAALNRKEYAHIAVIQVGRNPAPLTERPRSTGRAGSRIDYYTWDEYAARAQGAGAYDLLLVQVFTPSATPVGRLEALASQTPMVVAYMTTPYKVPQRGEQHQAARAVLIAFEAAREAQQAVLDLLTGQAQEGLAPPTREPEGEDTYDPTTQLGSDAEPASVAREPQGQTLQSATASANLMPPTAQQFAAVDALALEGIRRGAFPGCQIYVAHRGQVVYNKAFGTLTGQVGGGPVSTEHIYDVASITKALATTPVVMHLLGEKRLSLSSPVSKYLPELRGTEAGSIRLDELLWHQSGLPAGYNFFRDLIDPNSYEGELIRSRPFPSGVRLVGQAWGNPHFDWLSQYISPKQDGAHAKVFARGLYISPQFKTQMMSRISEMTLRQRGGYRYSDLSFVLLQWVAERVSGQALDAYFQKYITAPIGAQVYYTPLERGVRTEQIVPSQKDDFLRKQVVRGTVDDETAACLGGVAGNAGLFASATELGKLCQLILQRGQWQGKQVLPRQTVEHFLTARGVGGRRALGFDRPKAGASNPAADSASPKTVGHMGFTGTVFWIDPANDLVFIFLSNRTYPTRQNGLLSRDRYRPRLHQLVYDALSL